MNIGTDVETSVLHPAKLMFELYGPGRSKVQFVTKEEIYDQSHEDIPRQVPDYTKMRTLLGVTLKVGLREGTVLAMEWFRREGQE